MFREAVQIRNMYGKISWQKAGVIRDILQDEKYKIPAKLTREIEFDLRHMVVPKKIS